MTPDRSSFFFVDIHGNKLPCYGNVITWRGRCYGYLDHIVGNR